MAIHASDGPSLHVGIIQGGMYSVTRRAVSDELGRNERHRLAVFIITQHLDRVASLGRTAAGQLCHFLGGEGGTGKSHVISAISRVFHRLDADHQLLITALSSTAAAQIDG